MSEFRAPEKGLVSVIVAGSDVASVVEATLRSALDQTYARVEVVFVDSGSEDETRAIVGRLAPRVRLLERGGASLPEARSAGVHASAGQFLAFLHPGDAWAPGKIASQIAVMEERSDVGLVFTRARVPGSVSAGGGNGSGAPAERASAMGLFPAPGSAWERTFEGGIAQRDPAHTYGRLVIEMFVPYSSILARRSEIPIEGPFRPGFRFNDDYDFVLRMSELKRFAFLDEPLTTCATSARPSNNHHGGGEEILETLAIFGDNLGRNEWLRKLDPGGMKRREATLLREAGAALLREGRGAEARPLLLRAWSLSPLDARVSAAYLASLVAPRRPAPRAR